MALQTKGILRERPIARWMAPDTSTQLDARFTDGASVDAWALESVALLTNNGIMTGRDEGLLAPQDNITVEESIVLALALRSRF